jgi:hypothetical protein
MLIAMFFLFLLFLLAYGQQSHIDYSAYYAQYGQQYADYYAQYYSQQAQQMQQAQQQGMLHVDTDALLLY